MSEHKDNIIVIACRVFQAILESKLPEDLVNEIYYLEYDLHSIPKKLKIEVQHIINQIDVPSKVFLGYGLCGNGLEGIQSQKHTLIIPKSDDCIAILLGSNKAYMREFTSEPGTYYLTKGWLEAGSNPLQEYEDYVQRYGQSNADMIMDMQYQNYSRLMFIAQNEDELKTYQTKAKEVAKFCRRWDIRYEERIGSDQFINSFIDLMSSRDPDWLMSNDGKLNQNFVIIQPNDEINQTSFWR